MSASYEELLKENAVLYNELNVRNSIAKASTRRVLQLEEELKAERQWNDFTRSKWWSLFMVIVTGINGGVLFIKLIEWLR
jgi:hypothetical protein